MSDSDSISPTAHYTGYVWARNGLSHPELETARGRIMFTALQPVMRVRGLVGQGTLEDYLLARHRAIDLLLEQAVEQHGLTQVIELAAGLSPRGWRFARRYGDEIVYVETDLPGMAAQKRRALERMEALSANHRICELDVLLGGGGRSLEAVASELDPSRGLVVVAEGLVDYLPRAAEEALWRRVAETLSRFRGGRHICHIHLKRVDPVQVEALSLLLSLAVRTRVRVDFQDEREVEQAMLSAGFSSAVVHSAAELLGEQPTVATRFAHVLEAITA